MRGARRKAHCPANRWASQGRPRIPGGLAVPRMASRAMAPANATFECNASDVARAREEGPRYIYVRPQGAAWPTLARKQRQGRGVTKFSKQVGRG